MGKIYWGSNFQQTDRQAYASGSNIDEEATDGVHTGTSLVQGDAASAPHLFGRKFELAKAYWTGNPNTAPPHGLTSDMLSWHNGGRMLVLVNSQFQSWSAASATSRVRVVTVNGSPTGGTFKLTVNGTATGALAYNASAATVQTAVAALSSGATVTGSAGGPYTITFSGTAPLFTANGAALTGGSSPSATVTISGLTTYDQTFQDWFDYALGHTVGGDTLAYNSGSPTFDRAAWTGDWSAGNGKPAYLVYILGQEMSKDIDGKNAARGTAADYVAFARLRYTQYKNRVAWWKANGSPNQIDRLIWCWAPVGYHIKDGSALPCYPGDAYVDLIGSDTYNWAGYSAGAGHPSGSFDINGWNNWTLSAQLREAIALARNAGKKLILPETSVVDRYLNFPAPSYNPDVGSLTNDDQVATRDKVIASYGTWAASAANDTLVGICIWQAGNLWPWAWNLNRTGKHEGFRQAMILTDAASPGGGGGQAVPAAPTGVTVTSVTATTATVSWAANPSGDVVTGYNVWLSAGINAYTKLTASPLSPATLTYALTNLAPGTGYRAAIVAVNATGASVFSKDVDGVTVGTPFTTLTVGGAHSPVISALSVAATGNPGEVTLTITWNHPDGLPVSFSIDTGAAGAALQTIASGSVSPITKTWTYTASGTFIITVTASDGTNTTTATTTVTIDLGNGVTDFVHLRKPVPGQFRIRDVGPAIDDLADDVDDVFQNWNTVTRAGHNVMNGYLGSTSDPPLSGASSTLTLAAGNIYAVQLMTDAAGTSTNLRFFIPATAQVGTGSTVALFNLQGAQISAVVSADTALTGTTNRSASLSVDVDVRQRYLVVFYIPAAVTTAAIVRTLNGQAVLANDNIIAYPYRSASATASSMPTDLTTVGSWTAQPIPWLALT